MFRMDSNLNKDICFQTSLRLLENVFEVIKDNENVSEYDIKRFLEKVKTGMNLKELFQYFRIRREKKTE